MESAPRRGIPPGHAGLEERMPGWLKAVNLESEFTRTVADLRAAAALRQPTAVLFAPELVPGKTTEDQRALLTGLEEKIRAAFTWPDSVPLQLDLREAKAGLEQAGYRTVEVLLQPDSQIRFLPESVLPVVIRRALASGRSACRTSSTPWPTSPPSSIICKIFVDR
jgi:hypothetical protein